MADRKLNWKESELDKGRLTAPIDPPPDGDWTMAFGVALRTIEGETRGQQYEGWHVDSSGLQLSGVDSAALKLTADFFDVVVRRANAELDRHLGQRAQVEGVRAEKQESVEAEERAALEELRKRE